MRKLILLCTSLCAMAPLISASPVHAQNVLWVSNVGLDANTCSQTAPCATFQGAINKGGALTQINCLNSGSYGAFTVIDSLTIDCGTGNVGTVIVSNLATAAINLNLIHATSTVVLRHLSLNGSGTSALGIGLSNFPGGSLIVEDCIIQGFRNGSGIQFVQQGSRALLQVSNSQIFDNGSGIAVSPASGRIASVTLNQVELVANASAGLSLTGTGVVAGTMRNSVAGANGSTGVLTQTSQAYFTIEQSSIVANLTYGVQTNSAGAIVNVGGTTIGGNGTGVKATKGQLISFGNNQFSANGTDGTFTSTKALK